MSTQKLQTWITNQALPPRLLLSGTGDLLSLAVKAAAQIVEKDLIMVEAGLEADVKLCPDDGSSLKIGDRDTPDALTVRGLINWLNQTPVASRRVLVLQNLERTSRDAMQAWLKILEEPPARAQFILTTQNHHRLPTTILSRVTVLNINNDQSEREINSDVDLFLSGSNVIKKFKQIEALDKAQKEDPQTIKQFMEDLLQLARKSPRYQSLLPSLFQAHQDLERNVNRRLVLEHLALNLQNR